MKIRMLVGPRKGEVVEPSTAQAKRWIADRTAEPVDAPTQDNVPEPEAAKTLDGAHARDLRKRRS